MIAWLNRLLFSLRDTNVAEILLKQTTKLFPLPYRLDELLREENFYASYDLLNLTLPNNRFNNQAELLAGSISPMDLTGETNSPSVFSTYLPIVFFGSVSIILSIMVLALSTKVPAKIFVSALSEDSQSGSGYFVTHMFALGYAWLSSIILNLAPLLSFYGVGFYFFVLITEVDPSRFTSKLYWYMYFAFSVLVALVPILGPLAVIAASCFAMYFLSIRVATTSAVRNNKLMKASQEARSVSYPNDFRIADKARTLQIDKALAVLPKNQLKRFPLIFLGDATGVARTNGDPYSPDAPINGNEVGGAVCMNEEDMKTPVAVVGSSGTGKTVLLILLAIQWMLNTGRNAAEKAKNLAEYGIRVGGGALFLDAKGDIPQILKKIADHLGITDFIYITPENTYINLLDGYGVFAPNPISFEEGIKAALRDDPVIISTIVSQTSANDKNSKDGVWTDAARFTLLHGLHLISFGKYLYNCGHKDVYYPRSLRDLYEFVMNENLRNKFIESLEKNHSQYLVGKTADRPLNENEEEDQLYALRSAYAFFKSMFPGYASNTQTSILFTISAKLSELVGSPSMQKFLGERSDINIAQELVKGKFISVLTSEYEYGPAGLLATALIEQSLLVVIQRRPFRNPNFLDNEYKVLFAADEYGAFVSSKANVFSVSRSLGLIAWVFFQNYEQLETRLGETEAKAIWQLFQQTITFRCRDQSLENAVSSLTPIPRYRRVNMTTKVANLLDAVKAEQNSGVENKSSGAIIETFANMKSSINYLLQKTSLHSHDRASLDSKADVLGGEEFTEVLEPFVSVEELAPMLELPFHALVNIRRCDIPRRDIIKIPLPGDYLPYLKESPEILDAIFSTMKNGRVSDDYNARDINFIKSEVQHA